MKRSWLFISSFEFTVVVGHALGNKIVRELSVDVGSSVILNCTRKSEIAITWMGPSKSTTFSEKAENVIIPYTDGCVLNPYFKGTNIKVISNNGTFGCNLEITNFSRLDEGSYKCLTSDFTTYIFNIFVKNLPKFVVDYKCLNRTLILRCNPPEITSNYTFIQLEHRSEFNEHIRFLNYSTDGYVLRSSIEDAGLQDTGIYICNVSRDITDDKNGRESQWGTTLVELKDAPVFLGGDVIRYANIGEVIAISAVVYNRHNVTEAEIHSISTNQSKRNILKLKINITDVKMHKIFYGSNVTLNASLVLFHLNLMQQKDFTFYILKMCNIFGCRDIKIDIKIGTPRIPGNAESQRQHLKSVFATAAVLTILGIGITLAFLLRKRVKDKGKRQISRNEDSDEDTPRQSVANELYHSGEFVKSDNPGHLLEATESEGYVYQETSSTSENEPNSDNHDIQQTLARNSAIKTRNTI